MPKIQKILIWIKSVKPRTYVEILGVSIAVGAFYLQYESLQEQRIISAWQLVTNKYPGNSGKAKAIEFLAKKGQSLDGIDMSRKTNGGVVSLPNLDVSKKTLSREVDFKGANFSFAYLPDAVFEGANLSVTHFNGAFLAGANFEGANLTFANFEDAYLQGTNFKNSINFVRASFKNNFTFSDKEDDLPIAPDGFKFDFERNKDGTKKIEIDSKAGPMETAREIYFIKLFPVPD